MSGNSDPSANTIFTGDTTMDGVLWGIQWSDGAISYSGASAATDAAPAGSWVNSAAGPGDSALTSLVLTAGHYDITGDRNIDAALIGSRWATLSQTFSFPTDGAQYVGYTTGENINGFSAFNAAQQAAVIYAFNLVSQYTPFVFTQITETLTVHANHRFANSTDDDVPSAYGNFPSDWFAAGDAWFNLGQPFYSTAAIGNWGHATIMHEIGHTMGLKHGHQDYTSVDLSGDLQVASPRYGTRALESAVDGQPYSLMTYRGGIGSPVTFQGDASNQPQTYMLYDIAALQALYGANYNANSGNSVYTFSTTTGQMFIDGVGQGAPSANIVFRTVWDGNGIDTYDLSNYSTPMSLDLNPGEWLVFDTDATGGFLQRANNQPLSGGPVWAPGNVANALLFSDDPRALIENAIGGSSNDTIVGNRVDNILIGGGGDDDLDGGDGTGDKAVYFGVRSQYTTSWSFGAVHIADQRAGAPDGTDDVSNVELFSFLNRIYTLLEVLNQPPVLLADTGSPHELTERAGETDSGTADTVSGALSFSDEVGDTHTAAAVLFSATWPAGGAIPVGTQAALVLAMSADLDPDDPAGSLEWDFSLTDSFADFLAVGETLDAVYDLTIADQLLNSATRQVTIRFTGTNDAPIVVGSSSDLTGSIMELANTTGSSATDSTSGVVAFSDSDLNDRPTATIGSQTVTWQDLANDYTAELSATQIAALTEAFTIAAAAGNTNVGQVDWNYDIVDSLIDFLAVGETVTVSSEVIIDDQNGDTVAPDVVVTLYGVNDAPIGVPDSNGLAKASTITVTAAGGVLGNDTDPDIHDSGDLYVSAVNDAPGSVGSVVVGKYGSLTLNANGSYVYVASKGSLPSKIVAQDVFTYTVNDGHGGTDTATLSIVVFNPGVSYQAGIDTTLIGGNGQDVLDGAAGGNVLIGGNGADVLIGGDGNTLTGGNGPDTFLFRPDYGANTITDFDVHTDAIQFDTAIFTDVADVLAHTADTAGGAVITDDDGNAVTLVGISLADLQAHTSVFPFG